MSPPPIACSLTAPGLRARRHAVLELLRRHGGEQRPLPNGYRLGFEPSDDVMVSLADHGPMSLELTGPAGTREFLEAERGLGPRDT